MKKLCRIASIMIAALILMVSATQASAEDPLNLLFFGGSFTANFNVPWMVSQIAHSDGHPTPMYLVEFERSVELDYHIDSVNTSPEDSVSNEAIAGDTWDYVVIQGGCAEITIDPADFRADAQTLYTSVRDHSSGYGAGVTGVLYETWAYTEYPDMVPNKYSTLSEMQTLISRNYVQACDEINAAQGGGSCRVATAGDAFETMDFDSSLYGEDDVHSTLKGSVLAALMLYRTIYDGEYVSDITYADCASWQSWLEGGGVTAEVWGELTAAADATPVVVPEPVTMALLGAGAMGLLRRRRGNGLHACRGTPRSGE